ncbi:tRNA-splicing endonuclease subunit SEN34 [Pseudozyma hubeiensis]|nr:tRNA-splicing endonuclease subunit SEN34 [Pseudozyma hubeiensis]
MSSPLAEPSSSIAPPVSATILAQSTINTLTSRFPDKVQIHLHPSSSLPPSLDLAPGSDPLLPVALIWTVSSLRLLRSYGLVGSFTGTLAQFPQQNLFLGLPIQLLPEEVGFLLRRGKAVVVDEVESYRSSNGEERKGWEEGVEGDRRSQQMEAWRERQVLRSKHSSTTTTTTIPTPSELDTLPWHYIIPTTSTSLPWYTPRTYTTLSSVQPVFPYPSTRTQIESLALFEHLLEKGYWCMNGLRFGGNYAVYPGDPLRYHSHFTAQLVSKHEPMSLTRLVASGRLGTSVKKTHVLCCVDEVEEGLEVELRRREEEKGGRGKGLDCVRDGRFDTADGRGGTEKAMGRRLATFDVFSLAWAGFGT